MNNPADMISQKEKREVLRNDHQVAQDRRVSTYRDAAQASVDDLFGGRFATIGKPTVTGTGSISYPRLPKDAPSNQATMVPDEPPLGVSVDAIEPVGSVGEQIEAGQVLAKRRGLRRL